MLRSCILWSQTCNFRTVEAVVSLIDKVAGNRSKFNDQYAMTIASLNQLQHSLSISISNVMGAVSFVGMSNL